MENPAEERATGENLWTRSYSFSNRKQQKKGQ